MLLEDLINTKYEDFNSKLKEYGYYAIDGDSKIVKYEHETNKSEIRIFMTTEEEIYVDFYNANRDVYSSYNKLIGVSWYLGTKEDFKVDDIFEVLNNDELTIEHIKILAKTQAKIHKMNINSFLPLHYKKLEIKEEKLAYMIFLMQGSLVLLLKLIFL